MRKFLFTLLAALFAWSINAMAQTSGDFGNESGLHWELTGTSPNYALTISRIEPQVGNGQMGFDNENDRPWKDNVANISTIVIGSGVTKIGKYAFKNCTNLTSVTIGEDVASIRYHAFYNCSNLTSIEIPCAVETIEQEAFNFCTNLASVTVHRYYPTTPYITAVHETDVFAGCASDLVFHVPCSLYTSDANWGPYITAFNGSVETMTPCTNPWVVTPPTANEGLYYSDGSAQALVTAGTASHGQMAYRIGTSGDWSTTLPTATEIDQYDVYYGMYYNSAYSDAFGYVPVNIHLRANEDPQGPGEYYSTFFYSSATYTIPANTEAYIAKNQNNTSLKLTKKAGTNDIIPANNAFIIKANATSGQGTYLIKMNSTTEDATVEVEEGSNDLQGNDAQVAYPDANAYVLSGGTSEGGYTEGAGFYKLEDGTPIPAHKAYVVLPTDPNNAPRRLPFVFDEENTATGMEEVQSDNVQCTKVLIDGQLYLMYKGHKYDATGRVVE